ncbi:helix-turn-helix family protein [Hydrogenophaga sp. RAC07]|nr:helix-turn-helix family protein [Hydrogenophaga sp. RAC07]
MAYHVAMTTFADSLKKEIARVARKELRDELGALRKTSLQQRSEIAALKKQLKALQTQTNQLGRTRAEPARSAPPASAAGAGAPRGKPGRKVVFTAERLKTQRARLGLTQEQAARLLGVSSLSIWKWESGGAVPRASRVPKILERLALGKREALALVTPEAPPT